MKDDPRTAHDSKAKTHADVDAAYTPPAQGPSRISYDRFADRVGLIPNVRAKDNLFQAKFVGVSVAVGGGVFSLLGGWPQGTLAGALIGLVLGGFASGLILMIRGLRRR